jgi:hypothetical protein
VAVTQRQGYNAYMLLSAPAQPIIVRLADQPVRGFGLGDVLMGAVGVTGVMLLGAVMLGLVLAGAIVGYRKLKNRRLTDEESSQTQQLGLNQPASR